jgi:hypothetical protein
LVTTNLTKSDGSGTVSVRLLDTSSGGSRLASGLGGKLLTRSLSSGRFTSGLLFNDDETTQLVFVVRSLR